MSASEFGFLALGLILGIAVGAALVVVLRARPPAPREVRVTVAPGSLVRPAATLAHQALPDAEGLLTDEAPGPAQPPVTPSSAGTPDPTPVMDAPRALALGLTPSAVTRAPRADGTLVRSVPAGAGDGGNAAVRATPGPGVRGPRFRPPVELPERAVGVPIDPEPPRAQGPYAFGAPPSRSPDAAEPGAMPAPARATGSVAVLERSPVPRAEHGDGGEQAQARDDVGAGGGSAPGATDDPCAEPRRVAGEREAIAGRAADGARAAADALREGQRAYDEHISRAEQAERDADPRAIRAAKDVAQRTFHEARARAINAQQAEAAATTWLQEINAINRRQRDARGALEREQAAARELLPRIERLSLEADAARIAAESAAAAVREAHEAVAACEEAQQAGTSGHGWDGGVPDGVAGDAQSSALAMPGEGLPVIVAILRGEQAAFDRAVARIGGGDPEEARRWRIRLAALVDAISARAIEASHLDFPERHRFWGPFTRTQCREIVAALASLGFRFDGLGGFADGRVPGQRDLSLAVGYAGLDPMRIRTWPAEAEMQALYAEAVVAADEWLAGAAGELTLGEMVDALGRRADELTEVWNAWGRLRPILLADA